MYNDNYNQFKLYRDHFNDAYLFQYHPVECIRCLCVVCVHRIYISATGTFYSNRITSRPIKRSYTLSRDFTESDPSFTSIRVSTSFIRGSLLFDRKLLSNYKFENHFTHYIMMSFKICLFDRFLLIYVVFPLKVYKTQQSKFKNKLKMIINYI